MRLEIKIKMQHLQKGKRLGDLIEKTSEREPWVRDSIEQHFSERRDGENKRKKKKTRILKQDARRRDQRKRR